jgi:hypothetical protein
VQNQRGGRQIAPSRSPLKDLSVCGEVGDLTAVSDGYGKSDAHLPRFFSVSESFSLVIFIAKMEFRYGQVYKFQGNDLPITLTGKLDGGALKGAADWDGMLQSDWKNKRGN